VQAKAYAADDRDYNLTIACAIYRLRVEQYPDRLVMLCDRARCWRERSARDDAAVNGACRWQCPLFHDLRTQLESRLRSETGPQADIDLGSR
jgi:hypothetical protein